MCKGSGNPLPFSNVFTDHSFEIRCVTGKSGMEGMSGGKKIQPTIDKHIKGYSRKRRWHQVVMFLAAIVVFCTTYALILPAISMEEEVNEEEQARECDLSVEGSDYRIAVHCGTEVGFRADTELTVKEIEPDSDVYKSYMEQVEEVLEKSEEDVVLLGRFYEIGFENQGEELEAKAPLAVTVTCENYQKDTSEARAYLVAEQDGQLERLETEFQENADGSVSFLTQELESRLVGTIVLGQKEEEPTISEEVIAEEEEEPLEVQSEASEDVVESAEENNTIVTANDLHKLENGGTYTLEEDVTITDATVEGLIKITGGKETTLNLNGHKIIYNPGKSNTVGYQYLLAIYDTSKLTIIDEHQPSETTEIVTDKKKYGNLAEYNANNETLTYYVTESTVNEDGITTTETLVKHVVNLQNVGAIESTGQNYPSELISLQGSGAKLDISGGRYTNPGGNHAIYVKETESQVSISGGYFCGTYSKDYGGALCSKGRTEISGGVFAANAGFQGGAIYCSGVSATGVVSETCTFSMSGGTVSGNSLTTLNDGDNGKGAGIALYKMASSTFTGGYVTNNRVDYFCGVYGEGGHHGAGIYQLEGSMNLSGTIKVTGNYHKEAGGGITFHGEQLIMNGGIIAANVADTGEGGGIRLDTSTTVSQINGGYITNNRTNTKYDWGGGGIFVVTGYSLQIRNALITQNHADGFGGGVGGCSTGQLILDSSSGGIALYGNTADGKEMAGEGENANSKQQDLLAQANETFMTNGYADFFCAMNSVVSGDMLGGGSEKYHGSMDYTEVDIKAGESKAASRMMGLTASPSADDIAKAKGAATLCITGNFSGTHGGGITSNGMTILGEAKEIVLNPGLEIQTQKVCVDENGNCVDLTAGQFHFLLLDEQKNILTRVENDAKGNVVIEPEIPDKVGTLTYYLQEEKGKDSLVTYDDTMYRLDVQVVKETRTVQLGEYKTLTIDYYIVKSVTVSIEGNPNEKVNGYSVDSITDYQLYHRATVTLKRANSDVGFTNVMKDEPLYLEITKTDGTTNQVLQFVEFTLKDESGNTIKSSKTGYTGKVSFQLEKGKTYQLYETTPKGYKEAGPWLVKVDETGNATIYQGFDGTKELENLTYEKTENGKAYYLRWELENYTVGYGGYILPNTGGVGTIQYRVTGLILFLFACCQLYRRLREKYQ